MTDQLKIYRVQASFQSATDRYRKNKVYWVAAASIKEAIDATIERHRDDAPEIWSATHQGPLDIAPTWAYRLECRFSPDQPDTNTSP